MPKDEEKKLNDQDVEDIYEDEEDLTEEEDAVEDQEGDDEPEDDYKVQVEQLKRERDEYEKRYNDTRTAFNENNTRLGQEISQLREMFYQRQQQPAQEDYNSLMRQYSEDPSPDNLTRLSDALVRQRMTPLQKQMEEQLQQMRMQAAIEAQRVTFRSRPEYANVDIADLENSFNPQTGGRSPDYEEAYLVYQARKAGGVKKYLETVMRQGESRYLDEVRKSSKKQDNGGIPTAGKGKHSNRGKESEPDWSRMTDEEILKWDADRKERYGT